VTSDLSRSISYAVAIVVAMVVGGTTESSVAANASRSRDVSANSSGDFHCSIRLRLYDPQSITRLFFLPTGYSECVSSIPGVTVTPVLLPHQGIIVEGFPKDFHGPAAILECEYDFSHSECQPTLHTVDITWYEADDPSGALSDFPTLCPDVIECSQWPCGDPGPYVGEACGDADANGTLSAIDALITLRAAVSIGTCELTTCDADGDQIVNATDALLILDAAVGINASLVCPAPCTNYIFPT